MLLLFTGSLIYLYSIKYSYINFLFLTLISSKINIHKLKPFYCQLFSIINSLFIIYVFLFLYCDKYIKLLFNRYILFSMFFESHYSLYGLGINIGLSFISFIIMFAYYTKRKCVKVYLCLYIKMKVCTTGYLFNMKLISRSHYTFYLIIFIKVQYSFNFFHYG